MGRNGQRTITDDILGDKEFHVHLADCVTHMAELSEAVFDHAVFSPPFPLLYAYNSDLADLGNSEDLDGEAKLHFSFFVRQLIRVMKPGRVVMVHCMQIVRLKRAGGEGLFDFRGFLIRLAKRAGLIYEYDWLIRRNPQSQAIRTHSHELQFAGLEKDRAQSRGALGDYLIKFRIPGDNTSPVNSRREVSRNQWIEWAEPCWTGIKETDTLNVRGTKGPDDTRHVCPLQLPIIERCVRMYSNPGEIVYSPFAGIGSELHVALKLGRRAYGCELKPEYHTAAIKNCERAIELRREEEKSLFDGVAANA